MPDKTYFVDMHNVSKQDSIKIENQLDQFGFLTTPHGASDTGYKSCYAQGEESLQDRFSQLFPCCTVYDVTGWTLDYQKDSDIHLKYNLTDRIVVRRDEK